MSNSSLVTYTKISPNKTVMSNKKITHIVIHHMAGCLTIQQCGNVFANKNRQASSNYGVDGDGIGLYVDEKDRAWTTGSREIDQKAVTIEVSNSETGGDWPVSDA
ncbi:MAG: N-acetylmuramoyl-L-alanine amidase, partial [Pseudobutyrivibrio sp.]|nr:N-acetylmuramoyl-L-alanine amidase [Pseudobutyrivibrio sp.]